jgi:hypothetical protein
VENCPHPVSCDLGERTCRRGRWGDCEENPDPELRKQTVWWVRDKDADGYGTSNPPLEGPDRSVEQCDSPSPSGYWVRSSYSRGNDTCDEDRRVYPGNGSDFRGEPNACDHFDWNSDGTTEIEDWNRQANWWSCSWPDNCNGGVDGWGALLSLPTYCGTDQAWMTHTYCCGTGCCSNWVPRRVKCR